MTDTFTQIMNSHLEKLMAHGLTLRQTRIILAVVRMTFGYHKESCQLSLATISRMTGMDLGNVTRSYKELVSMKVIITHKDGGICLNDAENWEYNLSKQLVKSTSQNDKSNRQRCQNDKLELVKSTSSRGGILINEININKKTLPMAKPSAGKTKKSKPQKKEIDTKPAWDAYIDEFEKKFHKPPLRGPEVNSKMVQVVKKLSGCVSLADVPQVIRFWFRSTDARVTKSVYSVGLLLSLALEVASQWNLGVVITTGRAIKMEKEIADLEDAGLETEKEAEKERRVLARLHASLEKKP